MSLPFDLRRIRACELEFGAGGQRLGCKFLLDDGSLLFVGESEITSEIETLMTSLGFTHGRLEARNTEHEAALIVAFESHGENHPGVIHACAAQKVRAAAGSRNRDDGLGVRS
jgi:hypothetical protein